MTVLAAPYFGLMPQKANKSSARRLLPLNTRLQPDDSALIMHKRRTLRSMNVGHLSTLLCIQAPFRDFGS
jgi:hypothetical protein